MKKVLVYQIDINHIKNDIEFNNNLTSILEDFAKNQPPCEESSGYSITTCSDDSIFFKIDYKKYIMDCFYEVLKKYFVEINAVAKQALIKRVWCNRVFSGTSVKPHYHYDTNLENFEKNSLDLVAIFYYECPENSSIITFIDSDKILDSCDSYDPTKKTNLVLEEGTFIVHPNDLIHSVSEFNSEKHRTCFVFDIKLIF